MNLNSQEIASALDLLTHEQTVAAAPQQTEMQTGAFFGTTEALQDWDLKGMSYSYYSASDYVQDFTDTDQMADFRAAGKGILEMIINYILTAVAGVGQVLNSPPLSFIFQPIEDFVCDQIMSSLMGPIRGEVEADTSETTYDHGSVDAANMTTVHVGDPGGLFGLIQSAWEGGGFAAGYNTTDGPTGSTPLNTVTVYTETKSLGNLWDGKGTIDNSPWLSTTYSSVSNRLMNPGYGANPPLDLS